MEAHTHKAQRRPKTVTFAVPTLPGMASSSVRLRRATCRELISKCKTRTCVRIYFSPRLRGGSLSLALSLRSYVVRVSLTQIATLLTRRKLGCVVVTWSRGLTPYPLPHPLPPSPPPHLLSPLSKHTCLRGSGGKAIRVTTS